MTVEEARALILGNDADAIEAAASEFFNVAQPGVDADGNVWLLADERVPDTRLIEFALWARENWN
jgi:hypothetical protein